MVKKLLLKDFEEWKNANGESYSKVSYLHNVLKTNGISSDIYFAFLDFFRPEFIEIDGMIFIEDYYISRKHLFTDVPKNKSEQEFWVNYLCIDGLFLETEIEDNYLIILAEGIAGSWDSKLKADFPERSFDVAVIDENDDIGVTFSEIPRKELCAPRSQDPLERNS